MAGACHEDAGLMPHQEDVPQRSPVRHKGQESTANSIAGSDEARSVEDRVSTWIRASWRIIADRIMSRRRALS